MVVFVLLTLAQFVMPAGNDVLNYLQIATMVLLRRLRGRRLAPGLGVEGEQGDDVVAGLGRLLARGLDGDPGAVGASRRLR